MSAHNRRRQKVDKNQQGIVGYLRGLPGITVQLGMDDILVGYRMFNYWFELKTPESVSKRTGEIRESAKKASQKSLDRTWTGQRNYATTAKEILDIIGYPIER